MVLPEPRSSGFADNYLTRYAFPVMDSTEDTRHGCKLSVVIPSYDEPGLMQSVGSLLDCTPPGILWEILIVFNHPEQVEDVIKVRNRGYYEEMVSWSATMNREDVKILPLWCPDFPKKQAGVGLARKRGMDTSIQRFHLAGEAEGWIVGFDADTLAAKDYLIQLVRFINTYPDARTCNLYFEHPTEPELLPGTLSPIAQYELHLRYVKLALEQTGHPHAIHTVGSSFMVRADTYVRCGGMGRHQAGEDFYFLHKCVALGNFYELNLARVYPSPRASDRVVFGTGATIRKLQKVNQPLMTFNMAGWAPLKELFVWAHDIWSPEERFREAPLLQTGHFGMLDPYLIRLDAERQIRRLINESASATVFRRKFFQWFRVFNILQFLNQLHENELNMQPVTEAAAQLAASLDIPVSDNHLILLARFREFEKRRGIRKVTYSQIF